MEKNVTTDLAARLSNVGGYVIDMDGVLYRGDTVLPYVCDFLDVLNERQIPYVMATNNSMRTPEQYVSKLASMEIHVPARSILTSGLATRGWLKERYPRGTRVFVIGMKALLDAIFEDGYFVPAGADADLVVSGADFELTYDKLKTAALAIRAGAPYVATNADRTFPTEQGLIPGSGAVVAAITAATDVVPDVIGKPAPGMLFEAAHVLGSEPASTVMLGDRLDTDILAGERAGFITVLVLTGVTEASELEFSEVQPDVVLSDLEPLVEFHRER